MLNLKIYRIRFLIFTSPKIEISVTVRAEFRLAILYCKSKTKTKKNTLHLYSSTHKSAEKMKIPTSKTETTNENRQHFSLFFF